MLTQDALPGFFLVPGLSQILWRDKVGQEILNQVQDDVVVVRNDVERVRDYVGASG